MSGPGDRWTLDPWDVGEPADLVASVLGAWEAAKRVWSVEADTGRVVLTRPVTPAPWVRAALVAANPASNREVQP